MGSIAFRLGILFCGVFIFSVQSLIADDAAVLPKGRFRLRLISTYTEASNELGPKGEIQGLGTKLSRNLDAKFLSLVNPNTKDVVRALNSISPGQGDSLAAASLDTKVDSEFFVNVFCAEYGVTDRLSVGLILPFVHADISVNPTSTPDSHLSQLLQSLNLPDGHPLKSALQKMQQSTTVLGLNTILKGQMGYNGGLENWAGSGIGDLEVGGKYNYLNAHPMKMTLKAGLRLPTGRTQDVDQLTDVAFGDGTFAIGAYNYIDYQAFANTSFTLETGYTSELPNSQTVRVPLTNDLQIGIDKIEADRKLGDYWEAGLEANQTFFRYLTASAKYRFKQKFSDAYSAPGVDLTGLEAKTNSILHEASFQLEYTNLPAVRAGEAVVPYAVGAIYRQPFSGQNVTDTRTSGLFVKTYF